MVSLRRNGLHLGGVLPFPGFQMPRLARLLAIRSRFATIAIAIFAPCAAPHLALLTAQAAPAASPTSRIPPKLSDAEFWKLVSDFSESNGYFRSDNYVSNETTYQWVIPDLLRTTKRGGVYLGVGPDQNFTYIVALEPRIAFIFDIRRQNLLTHLMYKALIEQSANRADFVSHLFSRPRPPGLDSASTAEAIFTAFAAVPPDSASYHRNLDEIHDRLVKAHGFALSSDDWATLKSVYEAFVTAGPDITYNFSPRRPFYGRARMPSYAELQMETDSARVHRAYLASETNYRALRSLETNNLIVPLVGDFAGPTAIRAVASYLKAHDATVTAFYLSNVEQYLFQAPDDWRRFYANAASLPVDSTSTFIRSVFNGMGYSRGQSSAMRAEQLLASMLQQITLFNAGKLTDYMTVLQTSR
jgi:hypothetical protein